MWLGKRRGNLIDWSTQLWVRATGRRITLGEHPWVEGPIGSTHGIGIDYFDKWADSHDLAIERHTSDHGLLPNFLGLSGPGFDASSIAPEVAGFYERAADYEIDVWSEWSRLFRPFGWLVSILFSRRLEQLNLPLAPLDTSHGMTSEVLRLANRTTGAAVTNAWVRTLVRTDRIVYVGPTRSPHRPAPKGHA